MNIPESFVQANSLEYLKRRYKGNLFSYHSVVALAEVYTQDGKRADGLAFYQKGNSCFTASLEAKSFGTLSVLRPKVDEYEFKSQRRIFWAIAGISYIFVLVFLNADFFHAMLFWGIFILGDFVLFHNNTEKKAYLNSDVFRQIEQYPANERWLAVGEDCFDDKMSEDDLIKVCKKAKVGLLYITYEGQAVVLLNPVKRLGNYLPFYASDTRVSMFLN